jgi:hypothetical protein
MRDPAYAAFSALDPFFDIVRQGLAGLVDPIESNRIMVCWIESNT